MRPGSETRSALMPRDWESKVSELSDVGKLVHLSMRRDNVDEEQMRGELLKVRRRAYEHELTLQARRVGCNGRQGRLTTGDTLSELNDDSKADAESMANTYNYDLAIAIQHIRNETPRANRHTYAKRLQSWETARTKWKAEQVARWTEGSARNRAQADFYRLNGIGGTAIVRPGSAAEPVCRGLINRGRIPLQEAMSIAMPVHVGCIHFFEISPNTDDRVPRSECGEMWLGG